MNKKYVQSYILNLSFPTSLEELVEKIRADGYLDVEAIDQNIDYIWNAPIWGSRDDIVFFTHAKTANSKISKMETAYRKGKDNWSEESISVIEKSLNTGKKLYKKYSGTIFAYAKLSGNPYYYEDEVTSILHNKSRRYVNVSNMRLLENPIDVDEIKEFVSISKVSSITPLFGVAYDCLKNKIITSNSIDDFLLDSISTPYPLKDINDTNWLSISNKYRHKFMYEAQFRYYYVDYLLKSISERKKIYKECRCKKDTINSSYIDNVISIFGKYLPVEVKLNVSQEKDLRKQVRKYCYDDYIELDCKKVYPDSIHSNYVMIVDTNVIQIYDYTKDEFYDVSLTEDIVNVSDLTVLSIKLKNLIRD